MKYEHATWRPRRKDCSPPAIEQFPRPLMGPSARKHGGLIIHILVAIYTFLGLAIVCDDYFVSSLDRICEGNESFKVEFHFRSETCAFGRFQQDAAHIESFSCIFSSISNTAESLDN